MAGENKCRRLVEPLRLANAAARNRCKSTGTCIFYNYSDFRVKTWQGGTAHGGA